MLDAMTSATRSLLSGARTCFTAAPRLSSVFVVAVALGSRTDGRGTTMSDRPAENTLRYWWFRRRHGSLIDALRRSTELLEGQGADHIAVGGFSDYYREEVDHSRAVNARLIRHYDPAGTTDRRAR